MIFLYPVIVRARPDSPSPSPPPPQKEYGFHVEVPFREAVVHVHLYVQPPVSDDVWSCHASIWRHGIYESRYHERGQFNVLLCADDRCDALRNSIAPLSEFLTSWRTDEDDSVFQAHAVELIVSKLTQRMAYFEIEQRRLDATDSE